MDYVTHKRDDGAYQSLLAHLQGVAERAEAFAGAFGAQAHARRIGMLHDIGKYSPAAQARQRDPEHVAKVDHASAGAQVVGNDYRDACAAFAIAGHHGGLPDKGSRASTAEDGTLMGRIKKPLVGKLDYAAWETEVEAPPTGNVFPQAWRTTDKKQLPFAQAMYVSPPRTGETIELRLTRSASTIHVSHLTATSPRRILHKTRRGFV